MTLEVVSPEGDIWGWLEIPAQVEGLMRPGLVVLYPDTFGRDWTARVEPSAWTEAPTTPHIAVRAALWASAGAQPRLVVAAGELPFATFSRLVQFVAK